MKFFEPTQSSRFLSRPNRFTVVCELEGKKLKAFLPNPGRLQELLFPGVPILLEKSAVPGRTLSYTAVAVEREGHPVVLHTHKTNQVARFLIEEKVVPALRDFDVVRSEALLAHRLPQCPGSIPRRALPVRSSDDLECELASALNSISQWSVPGFGCSDCSSPPTSSGTPKIH